MKTLKYLLGVLAVGAMMFACEKPDNGGNGNNNGNGGGNQDTTGGGNKPSTEMPEVKPVDGKVVIVLNCVEEAEVCNGLVFAGNYNNNSTNVEEMAKFEAIEGYESWYKVEIVPADPAAALTGKPCQLASDGTFPSSWDYQWFGLRDAEGNVVKECEVIKGNASLYDEYNGEKGLSVEAGADVVYIRAYAWKKNPCAPVEKYTVKFEATLSAPLADSCTLQIAGGMEGWNGTALTPDKERKVWTVELKDVEFGAEYKYRAIGESGALYWELQKKEEGKDCAENMPNRKVNDVEMYDDVYELENLTAKKCEEEPAK